MKYMSEDTIAAVSTAMSPSGIGVVRISGPDAFAVADRVYRGKNGKKLGGQKGNTIHYGMIEYEGRTLDEVLVMVLRAPHSYTGEDTAEIDCHGGVLAVRKVLEAVLKSGARPAEPGEFTKRAFLNGRIDLSQAEAVMDIINAGSEAALNSSLRQLRGSVRDTVDGIRKRLLYEIAFIESALDDPEHISLDGYPQHLAETVAAEKEHIRRLLLSTERGKLLREGIRTVILGKPNAGKSSLLNVLTGEDKAIVTEIAGTTRDVLEEYIDLNGVGLHLLDTAGIREAENIVEQIGIDRAVEMAAGADLILFVADGSVPLDENDEKILDMIRGKKSIVLINKSDLETCVSEEQLAEKTDAVILSVSAKEETGIEELSALIREMFFGGEIRNQDEVLITSLRQKKELEEAESSLSFVENSIRSGMPEDFYSIDLMGAYEALGNILGESVGDDLVNEIFSKFCVGK